MNDTLNEFESVKPIEGSNEELDGCQSKDTPSDIPTKSGKTKEKTPGIIYLSSIPDSMQYNDIYKVFNELGEIGRISLQVGGEN